MENNLENRLIKKAIKGNNDAFEKIVLLYEKKVYNIAYQVLKNEHDAYDAAQEVFIKIFQKLDTFNFDASFSTWLHRITVNTCIDFHRKNKRVQSKVTSIDHKIETEDNCIERQIEDTGLTPEDKVVQQETVYEVRNAIELLKEDFKMVIILRDIQGYTYEEIAEILACNIGTVKSRLSRARNSLKSIILENKEQNEVKNVK